MPSWFTERYNFTLCIYPKIISFLLIDVFFNADSKSGIRIFWTALVFELYEEEEERKNRHYNTQVLKSFSMPTYKISFLYRYYIIFRCWIFMYENSFLLWVLDFRFFIRILNKFPIKIVTKKIFTIMIPTVISCRIMKCGGCEYRTKSNLI